MCCGSRMFWFDKADPRALFIDKRNENHTLCDGRQLRVQPDIQADFTKLPFANESFQMVVFDPPHLTTAGDKGWQFKKYGRLGSNWEQELAQGFREAFRVLEPNGTLIFKWNETQIKTSRILKLTPEKPVVGHISGKRANTHWMCFLKQTPLCR